MTGRKANNEFHSGYRWVTIVLLLLLIPMFAFAAEKEEEKKHIVLQKAGWPGDYLPIYVPKILLEDELGWKRPEDDNMMGHSDCALHNATAYMYQKLNDVDMLEPDVAVMVRFGAINREGAAELIRLNKPTAINTEKSLDSLCALCDWSREDLENTLIALK